MANAGASIEAVLTLNSSGFQTGITESTNALNQFINSTNKLKTGDASKGIQQLNKALIELYDVMQRVNGINTQSLDTFNKLSSAINKMANGLKILQSGELNVVQAVNTMNSIFQAFQGTLSGVTLKLENVATVERQVASASQSVSMSMSEANAIVRSNSEAMQQNAVAKLRAMGYTGKLSAEETKLSGSTNSATSSIQRQSSAMSSATGRTNQLASATSRLGKAMSSLRMIGSLVGSMLAYNFAHKLLVATGETIHAKSEMEGYFKMLNFGQGEINSFNQALDRTVAQFQRVNKYSLGETISSIGVEFNLTTQEMEKAMKVTSMITSEYLRAGRNANEASLAVKDVLQGQFQRLSRETGVKGEQLKEAGWSGDTTDVLGLMEALEKVGESRNWDVFAEKANSLNDILTITQNRFGEWSADMVYSVQPAIVGAFNMIMETAQKFASVIQGVWDWINGDAIEGQITKWALLGTTIASLTGILVAYRTGAGLVQVAQMGLTRSILATVLGLNAETVATYGSRTAIISKITGLEAEKVATMNVKQAIASKVLGLDAELVAQTGVKQAIIDSAFARELEKMRLEGATAEELRNTLALYENQLAQKSSIGLLSAQAMGLNMTTYATHGFTVALLEAKTGMDATKIASMGLAKKIALLGVSMALPTAIVGAFAVALGTLALKMNESAKQMEKFNKLVKDGDGIINDAKSTVEMYTERQESLNKKLKEAKEGTTEYYETQQQLLAVNKDLDTANKNLENTTKAVEMARSSQAKYNDRLTELNIEHQNRLAEAYMRAGYSSAEAYEMANSNLLEAKEGADQLVQTLEKIWALQGKGEQNTNYLLGVYQANGVDLNDPETKKHLDASVSLNKKMQDALEKALTDESFMGRMDGWFGYYQYQLESWINNIGATVQAGDWGAVFNNIWKGIAHGFADLPIFKDFWGWVYDQIDLKQKYGGKGWEGLQQFFVDSIKGFFTQFNPLDQLGKDSWGWDPFRDFFNFIYDSASGKNVLGGFGEWLKSLPDPVEDFGNWLRDSFANFDLGQFISDIFNGDGNGGVGGLSAKKINPMNLIKKLFDFAEGIDISWVTDWLNNNIITPITTAFNNFMADPLSYIDSVFGISDFINGLFGMSGGDDPNDINWAMTFLNNNIITPLQNAFNMFMTDPMSFLMGGVSFTLDSLINALFPSDGGVSILNWANTTIIQPLTNAISTGIASIPIISDIAQMLGLIPSANPNAQDKGSQLARAFGNALENIVRNIPILGDVLQILGLIPSANPTANSNGRGVGTNIKDGLKNGITGIADIVRTEMTNVVNAVSHAVGEAYKVACDVGNAIVNGIKNAMQMHSPSIISRELLPQEFGVYIPEAITSNIDVAYASAQSYGQAISDGISSVNMNTLGMDTMASEYQDDALMISYSSQMIGTDTTTAFNDMQMAVNTTTANMSGNVTSTYTGMQTKQASLLNTMKTQNQTAYNDMYTKSNTSLIQMRDSTSKTTQQMTQAWDHMKNQIVATANKLKVDSTNHFNQLSNTIGSFYRKIQNPSNWGSAGSPSLRSGVRKATTGRRVASSIRSRSGGYAGGGTGYKGTSTMTIAQLKKTICPNGDCGNLFDGYNPTQKVDVDSFLMSVMGEHGFGWNDWSGRHYNHIKTKTDEWDMKSPTIQLKGGIPTDSKFKVKDFESGQPKITFDEFEGMARSIFTAIPYRFYYDSSWKGSWLGALQAGACNCWDGAHALLAFANTCGFSGSIAHGSWNGVPHVWAVIEGRKMDTTGMQQRGTWTPSASAGGFSRPISAPSGATNEVHIHINMDNNTIYGVDDLDSRMQEAVEKGLQENFNNNYTIGAV